jgi:GNAT superfamily N-acetyltransferase
MTLGTCRRISTHEELLAASGGDAFVRWEVPLGSRVEAWALADGGVAFVRGTPSGRRQLAVVGTPEAALPPLRAFLDGYLAGVDREVTGLNRGFTVPRGTVALLGPDPRVGAGDDWEWMWTATAPPAHPDVVVLGPGDHDAIAVLLAAASPRHSARIGGDDVVRWAGVRDAAGRLVACAAHTEHVPGVPHLASVATHPSVRGRGLGAAVTGALTRWALEAGAPVVTLGMYSDNAVARRMYARLGFRCTHRWSSRRVRPLP